mmetsp:Transcript_22252/g.45632  ORF Transcript_22252/g.45632 Transcript_22252/m.45632 type:complete len:109 (-) Transcript_22252:494-820(-)
MLSATEQTISLLKLIKVYCRSRKSKLSSQYHCYSFCNFLTNCTSFVQSHKSYLFKYYSSSVLNKVCKLKNFVMNHMISSQNNKHPMVYCSGHPSRSIQSQQIIFSQLC